MTLSATKMTAEQYLTLGEDPPGVRLELVDGDVFVSPSPSFDHGNVVFMLAHILLTHIEEHDLGALVGDVDTIFGPLDVRRPDLIFIAKSRLHLLDRDRHGIRIAPDLCVEVISPGSATMDRADKFDLYAGFRVFNYWLIDPEARTFVAYRLSGAKYVQCAAGSGSESVSAPPFPKLKIPLGRLWRPRRKR